VVVVKAMKTIIPIKVAVVKTVEAECGVSHWTALHWHSRQRTSHGSAAQPGPQNARHDATEENEFFSSS
jgi:hypothetical protein